MTLKIVSGGQTGVDRAALDAALAASLTHGGWCPKGRRAEDGIIDARYVLNETNSGNYKQRTKWNVRDSDGTLIISRRELSGGSAFTVKRAEHDKKPYLVIKPEETALPAVGEWLKKNNISILNIAGPRETTQPGIYAASLEFLQKLFNSLD